MGESYANPISGGTIAGGRNYILPTCALVGDSLTDPNYGLTPFYWGNGLNGGKLQLLANCGVSGNTVSQMRDRLGNAYTNASPGLAGLPALGWGVFDGGTNDARNGTPIASLASVYTDTLNAMAAVAQRIIILDVPPLGGAYVLGNPRTLEYNAWLSAFAAGSPAKFKFIDCSVDLRDGNGDQITSYFPDGTHPNNAAVYLRGLRLGNGLASELAAYPSPLSKDAADVYPAQPQWVVNHTMAGTGGSKGSGVTGTVVNSVSVSVGGSSTAQCSIVAADGGDANQTPWQRIEALTGSNGGGVTVAFTASGRAISAVDPVAVESMIEVRFNAFDMSKCTELKAYFQGNTGEFISPKLSLLMGNVPGQNRTVVLRHKIKRGGATSPASLLTILNLTFGAAFAASIGSFDFRCFTIRG